MKQVEVRFETGRDVLSSYWGYLSGGGLVIQPDLGLDVGQLVELDVNVRSSKRRYSLSGRVVQHRADGRAVVAFRPGEPQDLLLSEALSETEDVPARSCPRYAVDADGVVRSPEADGPAHLLNISASGCCLRMSADRNDCDVGATVEVQSAGFRATGTIVWRRHTERGVRFDAELREDVERLVAGSPP